LSEIYISVPVYRTIKTKLNVADCAIHHISKLVLFGSNFSKNIQFYAVKQVNWIHLKLVW